VYAVAAGRQNGQAIRVTVRYRGQVQGVGFRYTTAMVAGRWAVSGCVANLPDGSVELVAEGERREVEAFLDDLRGTSVFRYVMDEQRIWSAATGAFDGFGIRHG